MFLEKNAAEAEAIAGKEVKVKEQLKKQIKSKNKVSPLVDFVPIEAQVLLATTAWSISVHVYEQVMAGGGAHPDPSMTILLCRMYQWPSAKRVWCRSPKQRSNNRNATRQRNSTIQRTVARLQRTRGDGPEDKGCFAWSSRRYICSNPEAS